MTQNKPGCFEIVENFWLAAHCTVTILSPDPWLLGGGKAQGHRFKSFSVPVFFVYFLVECHKSGKYL